MKSVRAFLSSMAGRIFLILLLGVAVSASLALALADMKQKYDFERARAERVADRVISAVALLDVASPAQRQDLLRSGRAGLRAAPDQTEDGVRDEAFTALLQAGMSAPQAPAAMRVASESCRPPLAFRPRPAGQDFAPPLGGLRPSQAPRGANQMPICWLISVRLADGQELRALQFAPPTPEAYPRLANPIYLSVLALAAGLLAFFVSRMAAAPLNDLARAAAELGADLERAPLGEKGPHEVKAAAHAFNAMQARLRATLRERTQMLAAITHDLQTPMTRMRLRLEKIEDEDLRERLISDLGAMQALIREGLELARSAESSEPPCVLDLDSLLESLVEDAAEAGHAASFAGGCGADVRIRAQSLRRCLGNLIDNAIQYGGSAIVACERTPSGLAISVCDRGSGIPPDQIEAVFEPFTRLEASRSRETGGAGLGLTIARALAQRIGATLVLQNRAEGGLEARLILPTACIMASPVRSQAR